MRPNWTLLLLVAAVAVVVALFLAGKPTNHSRKVGTPAAGTYTPGPRGADAKGGSDPPQPSNVSSTTGRTGDVVSRRLAALLAELENGVPPARVLQLLAELRRVVHLLPPEQAAEALIAFLETGDDRTTGLGFEIGAEGVMRETPTVRTAVVDLLGQTDPLQSVAYSRRIIEATDSPDEYALALRNLAWSFPGAVPREELVAAFMSMLARGEWTARPSRGFLEAFDVAVVTGSAGDLSPLLKNQPLGGLEPPLSRAAFVALDRMVLRDPAALAEKFKGDPSFLANAPFHRASLIARLDPRDAAQKDLLVSYLLRPDHAPGELEYFAEVFPNPNRFASNRLVTAPEAGGSIAEQAALDRAVLEVVGQLLDEPDASAAKPTLRAIREKLTKAMTSGP